MKTILWITNDWLHDLGGGRTIASLRIISHLAKNTYRIIILNFERTNSSNDQNNIPKEKNIVFISIQTNSYRKIVHTLIDFLKKNCFDLIICSSFAYIDLLSIVTIKLLNPKLKTKLILFEHTNPQAALSISIFKYVYRIIANIYYKKFDYIITPGNDIKKIFTNQYSVPNNKITTIRYPIISKDIEKKCKQKTNFSILKMKGNKIILTIARLNCIQKDFDTLLKAFSFVLQKIPSYLIILGVGPDKAKIKEVAMKLKITKNILFYGFQSNPYKYLASSDVFVLSSKYEGSPLVLVEAMACKIPVVSSNCNVGPNEILENGKSGLLVSVGNHIEMGEKIISILRSPQIKNKLIKNGLKNIGKYSVDTSLQNWFNYINKITKYEYPNN